jgi:hypothetical protein
MRGLAVKRPQLADGTGVNLRSLTQFVREAKVALEQSGEEEAAHFFETFQEFLEHDIATGNKPFVFTYNALGL